MTSKGGTKAKGKGSGALLAFMTIVGTVVGAGIFGVPFVYARSGWWLGLAYTVALGAVLSVMNLMVADTLAKIGRKVRLPGMARLLVGSRWAGLATVSNVIGYWLAIVAYLILGGSFLGVLFAGFVDLPLFAWQTIFFVTCSAVVAAGLKTVGRAEVALTGLMLAAIALFLAILAPHVSLPNYFLGATSDPVLPYGVIIFALTGVAAIPEAFDMYRGKPRGFAKIVVGASAVTIAVTAAIALVVVGVTGPGTTESMMDGLAVTVDGAIVRLGAALGLLAVATSFFANGIYLRDLFNLDYRLRRTASLGLALGVPIAVFLAGIQGFIAVIGFTGAMFGLANALVIAVCFRAARSLKARGLGIRLPALVVYAIPVAFAIGFVASLLK